MEFKTTDNNVQEVGQQKKPIIAILLSVAYHASNMKAMNIGFTVLFFFFLVYLFNTTLIHSLQGGCNYILSTF